MKKETWRKRHGKKYLERKRKEQEMRPGGAMLGKGASGGISRIAGKKKGV
ncbi:MAG: hypothetical protein ACXQTS_07130 [Candidatus Methanospirareceae archaeon]